MGPGEEALLGWGLGEEAMLGWGLREEAMLGPTIDACGNSDS